MGTSAIFADDAAPLALASARPCLVVKGARSPSSPPLPLRCGTTGDMSHGKTNVVHFIKTFITMCRETCAVNAHVMSGLAACWPLRVCSQIRHQQKELCTKTK